MKSGNKKKWKRELELYQRKVQQSEDRFISTRKQLVREASGSFLYPNVKRLTLELQWEFYHFCNCFPMIQWTIETVDDEINSFSPPNELHNTAKPVWHLRNLMHHEALPTVSFVTQGNNYYTLLYRQDLRSLSTDTQSEFNRKFGSMFTKTKNGDKQYAKLQPFVESYTAKAVAACEDSTKQL